MIEDNDVDYEKEILQFKKIWSELKDGEQDPAATAQNHQQGRAVASAGKEKHKKKHADYHQYQAASSTSQPQQDPTSQIAQAQRKIQTMKKEMEQLGNKATKAKVNVERQSKPTSLHRKADHNGKSVSENVNHNNQDAGIEDRTKDIKQRNPKNQTSDVITFATKGNHVVHRSRQRNHVVDQPFLMPAAGGGAGSSDKQIYERDKMIEQKNQEISLLRISNNRYHDQIAHYQNELQKRDDIIAKLRSSEMQIKKKNTQLVDKDIVYNHNEVEYENYKHDVRRLLNMLKNTAQYKEFATLAINDGGVRMLHEANKKHKTCLDNPKGVQNMHFCSCNKAYIPQAALWVPENIFKFSRDFVNSRKGDLSTPELQLLLYDLNNMWRAREKNIINTLNSIKANEIGSLRRRIQELERKLSSAK